jgi:hypothetical protein
MFVVCKEEVVSNGLSNKIRVDFAKKGDEGPEMPYSNISNISHN